MHIVKVRLFVISVAVNLTQNRGYDIMDSPARLSVSRFVACYKMGLVRRILLSPSECVEATVGYMKKITI
jgi:hypothetical protein